MFRLPSSAVEMCLSIGCVMFTGEKLLLKSQPFISTFPVSPSEWMAKFPTQVSEEVFAY